MSDALPWTETGVLNETENGIGYLGTDKEVSNTLPWTDNGVLNETENGMGCLGQTRKLPTVYLGQTIEC